MPRRNDIAKILMIGSGPIVIGQSAEFDSSGKQACKALKAEGYEVLLVNSNPASIMTDPEVADRTYVEPLTLAYLEEILRVETEMMRGAASTAGLSTALRSGRDDSSQAKGIFAVLVMEPSSSEGTSMAMSRVRRWPTWMMVAGLRWLD